MDEFAFCSVVDEFEFCACNDGEMSANWAVRASAATKSAMLVRFFIIDLLLFEAPPA